MIDFAYTGVPTFQSPDGGIKTLQKSLFTTKKQNSIHLSTNRLSLILL